MILATSTRADGNMSFNWGGADEVVRNRTAFLSKHGLGLGDCVDMKIGDADTVKEVGAAHQGKLIAADALITREKSVFLFLITADCLPVSCHDPVKGAVGLAHCSRKTSGKGLVRAMIEAMQENFSSRPEDLRVRIGPGVRKDSYVLKAPSEKQDPDWRPFLAVLPDGQTAVDVVGYNIEQLVRNRVERRNIEVSPVDTIASMEYFSHYRSAGTGEPEGRFATIIGMK